MGTDRLNYWFTVSANIGVIAGLILVAVQINQNTQIAKAQITNDYYLADMELELAMMGDDPITAWTKAVYTPGELTKEEAAVIDRYFNYGFVQIQRLQKMQELGLAGDEWENRLEYLSWHLGNEVGRRWWAYMKIGAPNDFARMVDEILAIRDHTGNRDLLDAMMLEADAEQNQ